MIVISLTDCPPKVRGDLSKWLMEINTGVYVGNVNARVREELWERICKNIKTGRATMVYSAPGEQKMAFRIHNTTWEPVDFDGITLVRRPLPGKTNGPELPPNFSKAAQRQIRKRAKAKSHSQKNERYVVVDIETTGLSPTQDEIIELAAVQIENGCITDEFCQLVLSETSLTDHIIELTGITEIERKQTGIPLKETMEQFSKFIGQQKIVCHNVSFDSGFLQEACKKCGQQNFSNLFIDTLALARRKIHRIENYKLETIAAALDIKVEQSHRALADCRTTAKVFEKLKAL
ncbi:MAG: type I-E CRISPR-associated endoribonuclease Cas2e [Eubacteriales bacterium]|nr:type I-E CRISPR-associated endoribonuclease Cas2e [Eubacteriales bacterium]